MTAATLLTGLALYLPFRWFDRYIFNTTKTLGLVGLSVVTGLIGLLVYVGLSYLFKIREVNHFTSLFKKLRRFYYEPITAP